MAALPSMAMQRRRFQRTVVLVVGLVVVFGVLFLPLLDRSLRVAASTLGLLLAGAITGFLCWRRSRWTRGGRRRTWLLLTVAAGVAILGNVVANGTGTQSNTDALAPNNITNVLALVLSILALLSFPTTRRRGLELGLMAFDGLLVSGAMLVIFAVLVYPNVTDADMRLGQQVTTLLIPVLDITVATVALLLVLRNRTDRSALALLALGYVLYATSDLTFALIVAANSGQYVFGDLPDLGWIAGYLSIGLAATYPSPSVDEPPPDESGALTTAYESALVFGLLVVAGAVQLFSRSTGSAFEIVLWLGLLLVLGARQTILTFDNGSLRQGLELRVREQTADLRRAVRQNEVLLDSVGDGIYGVDHDGRVTFMNPAGAAALGFAVEDLLGRRAHQEFHGPQPDGTPYSWERCYITEAIRTGLSTSAEADTYVRSDGETFPVEISASPLVDREERLGAVVVFRDVTQRREVEKLKNEFLSVVSHELRTPLTSIRGSLGLLSAGTLGTLTPQADRMVGIALDSSERLTRLINDILDIERIESGTLPMEVTAREAVELLESSAAQISGLAAATGVPVEVLASTGLVMADGDRIVQTLTNLLGNAIKFSPPGQIVGLQAQQAGSEVVFRVSDHGRGIPADKLESIFERFEQVDSSDARQKGGSGLGLAISRGIVERHGGRIWAESEVGVGTTVSFTLPAVRRPETESGLEETAAPAVLICDDDPGTVEVLAAMVSRHGYRPIVVTDGREAVERVTAERPAAVVLDLIMPGTTGAQVMAELKASDRTRNIPVIVISGLGPTANPPVAESADGWLVKPVSEQRLVQTVSMAVAGRLRDTSVLLVEDDDGLAGVLRALLTSHGLNVVHVRTVEEAVRQGRALRPQVIVLDLRLPDGDGSEVVARLRSSGPLADTALIVYSASDVEREQRAGLELGRTVFLTKGRSGPETLEQRVLELVDAVVGGEKETVPHD